MESSREKRTWKEVKAHKRLLNAFRGLRIFFATEAHFSFPIFFVLTAVVLGFYFKISNIEWIALVFSIGLVFVMETFNTAIEIDIDLTSPEYHPYARDTKDVAAAAVLLSGLTAIIIALIIFLPKIL